MNDKLDILFSKAFCRMRHKTQLFNGTADDHYHTRLQHTIEVEEIALRMAKRLLKDHPAIEINLSKVSSIALLHDIGHTPFGHAGERALHEIVSGESCQKFNLPDFKTMNVAIGFKHNINSGLLYIENTKFDKVDYDILDGIVRHTKLYYSDQQKLDYGFQYIFHDKEEFYNNNGPKTLEGLIVAYADEIAQICSDYLDICLDAQSHKIELTFDCKPYSCLHISSPEKRIVAKTACDYLIDLFAKSYCNTDIARYAGNEFIDVIDEFNRYRSNVIRNNPRINSYDQEKMFLIKSLYSYYFNNPSTLTQDFFDDFVYRVKRIGFFMPRVYYTYIEPLSNDRDNVENLVNYSKEHIISNCKSTTNRALKDFRSIYKMYIRSLAIYISKMTDDYATHKIQKYLTENNSRI